jgi:hypothetical protein
MELDEYKPLSVKKLTITKILNESTFEDRVATDTIYYVNIQTKDNTTGQIGDLRTFEIDVSTVTPSISNIEYTKSYEDGIR